MIRHPLPLALLIVAAGFIVAELAERQGLAPAARTSGPVKPFSLPRLRVPGEFLSNEDLTGRVSLLNVWGTWCRGCRQEHGVLLEIADDIPVYGLNYKDVAADARRWLERLGDPYVATGFDRDGRVAEGFGVYAAPETFIIDVRGTVVHRQSGPLTLEVWRKELLPIVRKLQGGDRGREH